MAEAKPGSGFLGWLGRQVGYVKKAVQADVTRTVVHRDQQIQEAQLPGRPDVTLRRTVIDEVIVLSEGTEGQRDKGTKSSDGATKRRSDEGEG